METMGVRFPGLPSCWKGSLHDDKGLVEREVGGKVAEERRKEGKSLLREKNGGRRMATTTKRGREGPQCLA